MLPVDISMYTLFFVLDWAAYRKGSHHSMDSDPPLLRNVECFVVYLFSHHLSVVPLSSISPCHQLQNCPFLPSLVHSPPSFPPPPPILSQPSPWVPLPTTPALLPSRPTTLGEDSKQSAPAMVKPPTAKWSIEKDPESPPLGQLRRASKRPSTTPPEVIVLDGPTKIKRLLLTRRQAYLFREQLCQSIILDAFQLIDFEIDQEVRDLIIDELQFVVSTRISGYTLRVPERAPSRGTSGSRYLERYPGTEAENQWSRIILDRCCHIRERIKQLISDEEAMVRSDGAVLDAVTTICPPDADQTK